MRVNKDEVALFCTKIGKLVHEDSIMVPRETNGEESGLEAWNGPYTFFDFFKGIDAILSLVSTIKCILTICDE